VGYWEKQEGKNLPQSCEGQFPVIASWAKYANAGIGPDVDMLRIGMLVPTPGEGKPRASRLTEDEQKTVITPLSIAAVTAVVGGHLTQMDVRG